jgi:hypothetical protein
MCGAECAERSKHALSEARTELLSNCPIVDIDRSNLSGLDRYDLRHIGKDELGVVWMALFGGPREIGTFRSQHSLVDTRNLIVGALSKQLSVAELIARTPGAVDSIYFSEIGSFQVVLTAGNSTRDIWNFVVDLTPEGSVIQGHAYFDRKRFDKWMGNALEVSFDVPRVLGEASVKMGRWKYL